MSKIFSIAIDGPSGSGKSSVAKGVANKLNILHLNTGSLYRAIGIEAYRRGYSVDHAQDIKKHLSQISVEIKYIDGLQHTYLNGEDVTPILKSKMTDEYSAAVSDCIEVRQKVLGLQRKIASSMSVVMEGRDIGSVVLPNATYKFFVTASLDTRAKRRFEDYQSMGKTITYEEVKDGLRRRDDNDEHRKHSPLVIPKDAIVIESDNETLGQTINRILSYIKIGEKL